MTDLWQESTRDFEAERLAHRTASARIALADFIPYLTSAESTLDHENRVALIADRIEAAVHQAVGSDVGAFPVVHQAAMDALHADFQAVFTERQAEAQRVNARRAYERNQQRQASAFDKAWEADDFPILVEHGIYHTLLGWIVPSVLKGRYHDGVKFLRHRTDLPSGWYRVFEKEGGGRQFGGPYETEDAAKSGEGNIRPSDKIVQVASAKVAAKDHQPVTASRKQAGMVNLGNPSGSVAPGDDVLAGQAGAVVTRVIVHAPGNHPANAPIVDDMYAVEVQTSNGSTRWCGGTKAEIGPDLRVHWSRPDTRSASKKTAGGDYVFLTTDGRTEFGNIYNFDDSVATERGRGSLDDMKLLWREYLSSHGGSNEHHSPDQTRAVGLLADKGYYSALYLGGTGGVYIRTADRSKVAKRTPNIFVQASVGWSATTDQMGAAVGYLSREWGDHGYRIKQDDRPGVFECSHSDGSRFYISADAYGNTADVPDSTTASRRTAYTVDGYEVKAPGKDWVKLDTDDINVVEAEVKKMWDRSQPSTIIHVKNLFNNSITVFIVSGWGGGSIESVQSYEQFYGHPATASRTAGGFPFPIEHIDGDNLENPIETRIVPAAQSEGMWKVEGKFSDGWKNLLPAPATKAECEEWLRSTTLFGLNSTARRRTAAGIGDINAWADGFGNWHVRVETTGVGNEQAAHDAALSRLHEELAQRNGPNFAPEVVGITLNHRDSQDGKLTFYFDETNAHEARRRTAGENPFAKKEPGAPTDAADTEGQPSETDPTASDDPAAMEAGSPVTISYTLTGEKTDAGDVEGTFDSFDGTTAFFTYAQGKFGVTNEGGKWVDSAGTVFTFAGGAPVEDPNAQQPPADGKTEVDTTKKPKPLASRHTADAWGHQPDGAYRNPSLHPETPPADLYEKAKMHWGGVGAREINPGHVFTADGFTYAFVKGQDGSWSMEGNDGGGAEFRKTDGGWEFRTFYSNDGWQKLGSRQAAVTASRHPFARSAAAGSDSIIGEKGRQADARTILQQIGTMTLMSLGQRNTVDLGDGVMFQVGAGNPLRKVIIKLNARDYYDVEIGKSQRSTFNWIVEFQQRDLEASQLSTVLRNALDQVVSASRHTAEANPFDGDSDANPYAVDERTPEPSNDGTPDDMLDGPAPVSPQTTKPRQRPSGAPANGSSNDQPMGVGQGAA